MGTQAYKNCQIAQTVIFHGTVKIGEGSIVEDNVILGHLDDGELQIGPGALVRSGTVIYSGVIIDHDFQTGHYAVVRAKTKIGADVRIGTHSVIEGDCTLGDGIRIQTSTILPSYTVIEDNVFLGAHVDLTNDKYMVYGADLKGPIIRRGARIGSNATILPGVEIGDGATVAAASVVTKDVKPRTMVLGAPAREK